MKPLTETYLLKVFSGILVFLSFVSFGVGQSKVQIQKSYEEFKKKYPDFSMSNLDSLKIITANSQKSKQVLLTITANKSIQKGPLPPAFNISINDVIVGVVDTGKYPDAKAGDGIFTASGTSKSINPLTTKEVYKVSEGQLTPVINSNSDNAKLVWKCKSRISTNCPDCEGVIFGGPCIFCIEIECEVVWEGSIWDRKGSAADSGSKNTN